MKTEIAEKIKTMRQSRNMTQADLAVALSVSRSAVGMWENGDREPNFDTIEAMADVFNVPMSVFFPGNEDMPSNILAISKRKIPVLGNVAAGTPIFADEEHEEYVCAGDDTECDFCLRVQGDSMEPLVQDGDIVYVRQQDDVDDGQIGVVLIDDEATLKHIYHIPNGLQLVSKNVGKYPPMVFTFPECDTIRILGRAVAYKRRL